MTCCDHTLSVCRPSDYLHFQLLENSLMDFDESWYGLSTQCPFSATNGMQACNRDLLFNLNLLCVIIMPPDRMIGAYCFCPVRLFVCLSVCLSVCCQL